jgi:hypothetical protein
VTASGIYLKNVGDNLALITYAHLNAENVAAGASNKDNTIANFTNAAAELLLVQDAIDNTSENWAYIETHLRLFDNYMQKASGLTAWRLSGSGAYSRGDNMENINVTVARLLFTAAESIENQIGTGGRRMLAVGALDNVGAAIKTAGDSIYAAGSACSSSSLRTYLRNVGTNLQTTGQKFIDAGNFLPAGSLLSSKTVTWSVTSGSLSVTSSTTNSSGQASVTYTAPTVTAQTTVTITASFAGDSSYQSSSGSSAGTVTATTLSSTTLSVSPSSFTMPYYENATTLTATLRDSSGNPLQYKTVSWSTTSGHLSSTTSTTDFSGNTSVAHYFRAGETSATITASFAGDSSYQASSATSFGSVTEVVLSSTTLSVSPSSFTMSGGESTSLTATLSSSGSLLTNKTVTWSVTSGSLSATSSTTNSSGQASVTYTVPTVATQTTVTITASFAGDSSYSSSQASSVGIVSTTAKVSTSIIISPLAFDANPEENVSLTILLTEEDGTPITDKTVTLSTTIGSITPSSSTTNSSGIITATFTAPTVDVRTSFIITASFAGDDEYSSKTDYSRGTVLTSVLAETVGRLENTMERLEVSVENLTSNIESLTNAIAENRVGLSIGIENGQSTTEYEHPEIDAQVEIKGTNIEVRVDSLVENGKTVLINIDNYTKKVLQLDHITVWIDGEEITQADNYNDVLDPTNDGGEAEYLILVGGNGVQVLVSIPHFSARTITIGTMPTVPTTGIPPLYLVTIAALALVAVLVAIIWRYTSLGRKAHIGHTTGKTYF